MHIRISYVSIVPTVVILAALLESCSILSKYGLPLGASQILSSVIEMQDTVGEKTVILVPMIHIGREKDYHAVADYLDSLKSKGFVTFNEGFLDTDVPSDTTRLFPCKDIISVYLPQDSIVLDTLMRKFRKDLGESLEIGYDQKLSSRRRMVMQSWELLRINTENDLWTDMTLRDYVDMREARFGEIVLEEKDFTTPLDVPCGKKKPRETPQMEAVRTGGFGSECYLNEKLERLIVSSEYDKIAVVYGSNHTNVLKLDLVYLQNKFVIVNGKK